MSKKNKQFVEEITPMEVDFPQWYTDVILKTDLVDYSPVKGIHGNKTIWIRIMGKYSRICR